jgi:hypothetical protein
MFFLLHCVIGYRKLVRKAKLSVGRAKKSSYRNAEGTACKGGLPPRNWKGGAAGYDIYRRRQTSPKSREKLLTLKRSAVFGEGLVLGYVRVKIHQVLQIEDSVRQAPYRKVLTGKRLKHENLRLVCGRRGENVEVNEVKSNALPCVGGGGLLLLLLRLSILDYRSQDLPATQAMVTPPSSESENLMRKVPEAQLASISSACFFLTKPSM